LSENEAAGSLRLQAALVFIAGVDSPEDLEGIPIERRTVD